MNEDTQKKIATEHARVMGLLREHLPPSLTKSQLRNLGSNLTEALRRVAEVAAVDPTVLAEKLRAQEMEQGIKARQALELGMGAAQRTMDDARTLYEGAKGDIALANAVRLIARAIFDAGRDPNEAADTDNDGTWG